MLITQILCTGCAAVLPLSVATTAVMMSDERSVGKMIDDKMIASKIKTELSKYASGYMLLSINVTVLEGRVMLTGSVISQECVNEAIKTSWSVKGVREVINGMTVEMKPMQNSANDTLIQNAIHSRLLIEKNLLSTNYKVSVDNGVVHLLGIAQSQDEMNRAINIASTTKGVNKVINYIILKTDPRRG